LKPLRRPPPACAGRPAGAPCREAPEPSATGLWAAAESGPPGRRLLPRQQAFRPHPSVLRQARDEAGVRVPSRLWGRGRRPRGEPVEPRGAAGPWTATAPVRAPRR